MVSLSITNNATTGMLAAKATADEKRKTIFGQKQEEFNSSFADYMKKKRESRKKRTCYFLALSAE